MTRSAAGMLLTSAMIAGAIFIANLDSVTNAASSSHQNFIVVFCDNLGYGDIEPFGSTLHRTPALNTMAAEGRKFTHFCVTAGVCTPSRASLITGCYAQRVGMHVNPRDGQVLRPISPYGLSPDEITIAEILKQANYATAIIGKWHLGDQDEFLPTRQGFDFFFGVPYSDDMTQDVGKRLGNRFQGNEWPPLPLMENGSIVEAPCDRNGLTKRYTDLAIDWIRKHHDRPFFLYMPQAMPGSTRTPFASDAFRGKSRNGPWGDSIEELDWSVGRLMNELKRLGIDENTLLVWTSDNGAPIHANPNDLSRGSNRPLYGRGYTTSEGAFRVPTLMWQPGRIPAGSQCDALATTMDFLPTFAKLAGTEIPRDRTIDGHDISNLIFSRDPTQYAPDKSPYDAFYYFRQDQLQAIRSGPWKLFLPFDPTDGHPHLPKRAEPRVLLFHLYNDVRCQHNIAADHPEVVERLTRLAEQARVDLGDKGQKGTGVRDVGKITGNPMPQRRRATNP